MNYTQAHSSAVSMLIGFFILSSTILCAQTMEAIGGEVLPFTPENLITNTFLGQGVEVTSIEYSGATRAVGHFSGGQSSIGIKEGIILSTGVASKVIGTGRDGAQDNNDLNQSFQSETDLMQVAGGADLRNVAKYTIKFIPTADTLRFRYVFASEEYPEFVCSEFNDVFGFFISGPGINGSFENGGENIAKIPGTNFPVSINHVNGGMSGVWGVAGNCNEPAGSLNFDHLFNDNLNSNFQPVYDGFTNVFTAQAIVAPCQEYTIKLTIADVTDEGYDSGVFLEAKSFGTQQINLAAETYSPDGAITEACTDGYAKLKLSYIQATDYVLNYRVFGSATNGVDYEFLPGTLMIPAGSDTATLNIRAFEDNILEPTEVLYIDFERDMCTRDTIAIFIRDNSLEPPVLQNESICPDEMINLDGAVSVAIKDGESFESTQLVAISPYNTTVSSEIEVTNIFPPNLKSGIIESVCMDIDHNNPEDLTVWLVAPNGEFMLLTSDNGAGGTNYTRTCFSPESNNPIQSGSAPFTGSFKTEGSWDDLVGNGGETNGTWKLMIRDNAIGSTGVLQGWSINFEPGYTLDYEWTGGDGIDCTDCISTDILPTQNATYGLKITDSYGCVVNASADVEVKEKSPAPALVCDTTTFNSVTFEWAGLNDISNYEISINGGTWEDLDAASTNFSINNLNPNETIDFEIRGLGDCSGEVASATCTTVNCTPPTVDFLITKEISCFEKTDANIELTASGSGSSFDFELNGTTNQTGIFEGLGAGTYTARISDEIGCFSEFTFDITEPILLDLKTETISSITCFGNLDGIARATATGGTTSYSFEWENGTLSDEISGLGTGIYNVTVTDANGCEATSSVNLDQPEVLTASTNGTNVSCHGAGDGNAFISPTGGTFPYRFEWENGETTQQVENLAGGIYQVTVFDANDCSFETEFEVLENDEIVLQTDSKNPDCHLGGNGFAVVTATGGTGDFSYAWVNGSTENRIENLPAGTYRVIVTDSDNCTAFAEISITNPDEIVANATMTPATCTDKNDGRAILTINGGTPDYQLEWFDGKTDLERSDLAAGTYTLQISDAGNCSIDKTIEITAPDAIVLGFEANNPKCAGGASGSIELNITGGTGNFQTDWGNGYTDEMILGGLSEGDYSVQISDDNSCTASANITLTEPAPIEVIDQIKHITCFGKRDGEIRTELTGGTGNYALAWSDTNGNLGTNKTLEFLKAGTYELYANDANGCNITKTFEINQPEALVAAHEAFPISCSNRTDGEILLEIEGGTLPYEVFLNGDEKGDTEQLSDLSEGDYLISIQDANNCVFESETILVNAEHPFKVNLGKDTLVAYGTTLPMEPKVESYFEIESFEWVSSAAESISCGECPNPDVLAKQQMKVSLKITDVKGCVAKDDVNIFVKKDFKVLVPTGFSPNGDGTNDRLLIHGTDGTNVKIFKIFDRWGEIIFEAKDFEVNDPSSGWDGTFRGKNMNTGVFVWYAETVSEDGTKGFDQGETTLIR